MRPLMLIGLCVLIVGIIALAVPSITYFTTERVADVGFFTIDMSRPHTIIINPIAGVIALLIGLVLIVAGLGRSVA